MTTSALQVDLLVIGWGKAGKTLAKRYAATRRSVALVERDPAMYGGTCINVACVPTKDLVVSAEARRPDDDPSEYFTHAVADRDELIDRLNAANHGMLEGVATLLDGDARFTGPKQVTVTTADGDIVVTAEKIVVGTGTVPARPDIDGAALPQVYDSTTIQHAEPFPERLVVVGAGFVGLEFANMFALFGANVTLLDSRDALLPDAEPLVARAVEDVLSRRGVTVRRDARVRGIEPAGGRLRVRLANDALAADAVLLATGRTPATESLNLEVGGIATDDRGFIVVDDHLRTSADGVFAVGDVNGGPQFTYISLDDNRVVWEQLTGEGRRSTADRVAVPRTTFVTPPLSQVGLTPTEARAAGHDVLQASKEVARIATMPRPKIVGDADGVISFTVDATTRRILGATLFCIDSQELVNLWPSPSAPARPRTSCWTGSGPTRRAPRRSTRCSPSSRRTPVDLRSGDQAARSPGRSRTLAQTKSCRYLTARLRRRPTPGAGSRRPRTARPGAVRADPPGRRSRRPPRARARRRRLPRDRCHWAGRPRPVVRAGRRRRRRDEGRAAVSSR
ncbi:MAG: FAD-dependent oxidoreductase [Terrabacter sp.]